MGEGKTVVKDVVGFVFPDDTVQDVKQPRAIVPDHDPLGISGGAGGVNDLHGVAHIHDLLFHRFPGVLFHHLVQGMIFGGNSYILPRLVGDGNEPQGRHIGDYRLQVFQAFAGNNDCPGLAVVEEEL